MRACSSSCDVRIGLAEGLEEILVVLTQEVGVALEHALIPEGQVSLVVERGDLAAIGRRVEFLRAGDRAHIFRRPLGQVDRRGGVGGDGGSHQRGRARQRRRKAHRPRQPAGAVSNSSSRPPCFFLDRVSGGLITAAALTTDAFAALVCCFDVRSTSQKADCVSINPDCTLSVAAECAKSAPQIRSPGGRQPTRSDEQFQSQAAGRDRADRRFERGCVRLRTHPRGHHRGPAREPTSDWSSPTSPAATAPPPIPCARRCRFCAAKAS